MNLKTFQARAKETSQFQNPQRSLASSVWNLNETVGTLSRIYDDRDRSSSSGSEKRLQDKLGDILWYVSNICTCLGLQLDEVAQDNLEKCDRRWGKKTHEPTFFDAEYPHDEQFPRVMILRARETKSGVAKIEQKGAGSDWLQIGARVTDNAHTDDGYRFHDVLHFAYVAVLGWSPVVRALMNRKRKSNANVDEVEDGARAINLEEALTALVYEHAKDAAFFENEEYVPFELLKLIERLTRGLEVNSATYDLWNGAILQGYSVWRQIKANKGGYVKCDMSARKLMFAKSEAELS